MNSGVFTISLDFELHWGVSHRLTTAEYQLNLEGTRGAIRNMLNLFQDYGIHATWATVGFLFCKNKNEIIDFSPFTKPNYTNNRFNNYRLLEEIGTDEASAPYHYAYEVIKQIKEVPFQEIATHTFSHLFTLEDGVIIEDFENDILAAISIAKEKKISINSIVFPRNQYNQKIINICNKYGLNFRGNPNIFYHNPMKYDENSLFIRLMRGLDSYFIFFPKNCFEIPKQDREITHNFSFNVPGSRFLRPYSNKLRFLESLKVYRIKTEMEYAAKNNKLYHLWWHPHNFGINTEQNLQNLEHILIHFKKLQKTYGMESKNMGEF